MPLYEYQCDACEARFERIQKFSDPPIDVCPSCGGTVKKLPSSPAIQFKGSGFYITDYAKKGAAPTEASSSEPAKTDKKSDGGDGAATKTESAPATAASDSGSSAKAAPKTGTEKKVATDK